MITQNLPLGARLPTPVYDRPVPSPTFISSRQHPLVKRCRDLGFDRDPPAVLLDGEHLVAEALAAGLPVDALLTDERPRAITGEADARGIARFEGTRAVLEAASPVRTTSGVVAIAQWMPATLEELLAGRTPFLVALVGVQDPGNVGGVIRTAHALGASGVLVLGESADPAGWKALRGAMGSTFKLPVARGSLADAVGLAHDRGVSIVATVAGGGTPLDLAPMSGSLMLLLGSEGAGLDAATLDRADRRVSIPMMPGVNSLNVSVSAALCLWEARRQRAGAALETGA